MTERPILFSGAMVRAILEGRKTQTRRVIKPQPHLVTDVTRGVRAVWHDSSTEMQCPYGPPGDRLWVRETFALVDTGRHCIAYRADKQAFELMFDEYDEWPPVGVASIGGHYCGYEGPWTPSIYMPRCFSRITLEIIGIRVERVQEITGEDAKAEGSFLGRCSCSVMQEKPKTPIAAMFRQTHCHIHGEAFTHLWDSINGKPRKDGVDISWAANPFVWVVEFEKV